MNKKYTFWYSAKHAQHYRNMNSENLTDYDGTPDPIRKNFCTINERAIPYTACTTNTNSKEPFENALKNFPDYYIVGNGTIKNITIKGVW